MPSIIIREINNTTGGGSAQSTDIVYVPGFVSIDEGSKPSSETAIDPRVPTTVYSVSDFETYFGKKPAVFKQEQSYPSISKDGKLYAFDANATPSDASGMFVAGDVDPGYVMAKELLNVGIPVIYERINGINEEPSVDDMYVAMMGTDDVFVDEYTKDENGDSIITQDETQPIVQEGPQTSDSKFQEYIADKTYYRASETGETLFIDGIKVDNSLRNDLYASYFVEDADGEWSRVDGHFSKTVGVEQPFKKLSARTNTNVVNGDRDLLNWYTESDEGAYIKSLNTYIPASVYLASDRYTVTEQENGDYIAVGDDAEGYYYISAPEAGTGNYDITTDVSGTYFQATIGSEVRYYPEPDNPGNPQTYTQITITNGNSIYFDNSDNLDDATDAFVYKTWDSGEGAFILEPYTTYVVVPSDEIGDYRYQKNRVVIEDGKAGIFDNLKDKGEYNVKYITSGGYPTYEFGDNVIVTAMLDAASNRGDCVALIDHTNNTERSLNDKNPTSVYYSVYYNSINGGLFAQGTYGTMFTPWAKYSVPRCAISIELPGSFGYLAALGLAIQTNDNWLAIAGATRGVVPYFNGACTKERLTNALADAYTQRDRIAINPITVIKPYGNLIWGNRTLYTASGSAGNNLNAWSFLNYRNLCSDIKKVVYETAKRYTFEQNSDVLWINFKAGITPLLDQMKSGFGLLDYKITKGTTTEKAKLIAYITIVPIYPVEDFDITIIVEDDEVTVS